MTKNKAKGKANRKADIRMAQGTAAADEVVSKAGGEIKRDKTGKIKRAAYEAELARLQVELVKLQEYIKERGAAGRGSVRGRDAAGGAGDQAHPRGDEPARVPDRRAASHEQTASAVVLPTLRSRVAVCGRECSLDRSWYNRAGVERVMGFCTEEEYQEFLRATPLRGDADPL